MADHLRRLAMINSDGKTAPPLTDPADIETQLYDLRLRVFARTPFEHLFTELGTVEAAVRALNDGCDGIFIDTFGDYGLDRIRAMTALPVTGAGEASIRIAGAHGRRFSIVTVWPPSMAYLYSERLAAVPGGSNCVGVHHLGDEIELDLVGTELGVKSRMLNGESAVVDEIAALCDQVTTDDLPEAILLGCTCMQPIADQISARCSVPVLEPSQLGMQMARQRLDGATPHGGPLTNRSGLASEMVDAFLIARGVAHEEIGGCDVCAVRQS